MLRHMLRDGATSRPRAGKATEPAAAKEPFLLALRALRERYEGKELSTQDLQKVLEEYLPDSLRFEQRKSLDWFFEGWVNGTAIPRLELENVRFSKNGGATVVSGMILQKEAPEDLVTSVPLYAGNGQEMVPLGREFADGAETPFRLRVPATAKNLVIDPYHTVLSRR
jgi:hypothetical protein